jgi:hypothetical protein
MTKLYIPSLGDEITLTKDWTFRLYHESRNQSLGEKLSLYGFFGKTCTKWTYKEMPRPQEEIDRYARMIGYYPHLSSNILVQDKAIEVPVKSWKNGNTNPTYGLNYSHDMATLPAGTILVMDRIYIRQGQSKFDSVTFYAKEIPNLQDQSIPAACRAFTKKPKGKARFWVKLADANQIEFEQKE